MFKESSWRESNCKLSTATSVPRNVPALPPPLSKGEIVLVKPTDRSGTWFKARVKQQVDVRWYEVSTEDGKIFRWNWRDLRSSKEPACVRDSPEPINMPNQSHLSESLTIPKPTINPPKSSAPEVTTAYGTKRNNLFQENWKQLPDCYSNRVVLTPKPVDRPVTRSGRISLPPSYLEDIFVAKWHCLSFL